MTIPTCKCCHAAAVITYTGQYQPLTRFLIHCKHEPTCPMRAPIPAINGHPFHTAIAAEEAWQAVHGTPDQPSEKGASK